MIIVYGSTNNNNIHTDTSNTLLGAKQYATRHGLINVSIRIGMGASLHQYKQNGKWYFYKHSIDELFE